MKFVSHCEMSSIKVSIRTCQRPLKHRGCVDFLVSFSHVTQGGTTIWAHAPFSSWYYDNIHVDLLKGCFTMGVVSVGECLSNIIWAILLKFVAGRVAEVLSVRKL